MLLFAKIEYLRPVFGMFVAIDPARKIFGFKNENSLCVDGERVDLDGGGAGEMFATSIQSKISLVGGILGAEINFRCIIIGQDIFGRKMALQTEDEASFGGGEFGGIG